MKSKKLGLLLTLALVLTSVFAFAQDAPKEEESPLKVSGSVNFFYSVDTGYLSKAVQQASLGTNYFTFDKIYVEFDHQLGKNFKYHVTLDALPTDATVWVNPYASTSKGYFTPFVREAYATLTMGDAELLKVDINAGLIPTKIIRYRGYMSDMRWLESMMFFGHYQIIGAYMPNNKLGLSAAVVGANTLNNGIPLQDATGRLGDGDSAQDLGIGIDLSFMKFLNFSFAVVNGNGVIGVTSESVSGVPGGKALYYDLLVVPMKGLFIHGYLRDETVQFINSKEPNNPASTKLQRWFAGAGVGIKLMGINAGVDFEAGQLVTEYETGSTVNMAVGTGGKYAKNFFVLNAWLNWNLQELAGFPLLVIGKVSYGSLTDPYFVQGTFGNAAMPFFYSNGVVLDTVHWYAGLGWQFNKNFRVAIIFEQFVFSDQEIMFLNGKNPYVTEDIALYKSPTSGTGGWNNANSKLMIKTESKF